ncbi:MAG: hypothetical protein Q9178_006258 [Gyalolechia marmorata]
MLMLAQPGLYIHSGSVVRLIDFGPGLESPVHRAMSIDYGIVLEGEFELSLDSGESRIMRRGDISVQRATAHRWRKITAAGTEPGRMLYILLDCKDVFLKYGEKVERFWESWRRSMKEGVRKGVFLVFWLGSPGQGFRHVTRMADCEIFGWTDFRFFERAEHEETLSRVCYPLALWSCRFEKSRWF